MGKRLVPNQLCASSTFKNVDFKKSLLELVPILKKKRLLSNISLKKSITLDKQKIELMANLELPHELKIINQKSIDGIGLFRTEYLYTDRIDLPTEYEQFIAYKKIIKKIQQTSVSISKIF